MTTERTRIGAFVLGAALCLSSAAAAAERTPTFTKDIAPIFQEKCEACHRPGSMAPMSLVTFEEARPWARSIRQRVSARQMPPWHIDKDVGIQQFKNDRSLSDDQIDTIVKWIDGGAPKGNPKDLPAPKQWDDGQGWNFTALFNQKEPDLVITSPAWTQRAHADDSWDKRSTDTGVTEPRWVRAIEIRPTTVQGRRITHHALAYLQQDETGNALLAAAPDAVGAPGLFMEWAVGKQGELMRPDTGKLLLPGSKINWDIHYSSAGEEITSQVQLGIYFYPKGEEPKYRETLAMFGAGDIDIPPNTVKETQAIHVLQQPGRIDSFQPHMRLRGKAMSLEAILPDGRTEILSSVSNFNFNWHTSYVYADEAAPLLPKGTLLHITAWHDNTSAKASNPDPNQWVGYGDRTVDEMAHAWINITYMSDDDFAQELQKRRAAQTTNH
jgi:hypothetical protein